MAQIGRLLSFDAGIEQILTRDDLQPLNLPNESRAFPGEGLYEQRLVEVLTPPSIEQELTESFRPEIANREVQTPIGYRAALGESRRELDEAVRGMDEGPQRETLKRAAERLDHEQERHELINTYRSLLIPA